uniref:(northern house mosquito) hypothetical protein n=1 Tax=Culex pipiens TaxID=7175 RepID=A0A8D7ZXQ0_CULPI
MSGTANGTAKDLKIPRDWDHESCAVYRRKHVTSQTTRWASRIEASSTTFLSLRGATRSDAPSRRPRAEFSAQSRRTPTPVLRPPQRLIPSPFTKSHSPECCQNPRWSVPVKFPTGRDGSAHSHTHLTH